MSDRLHATSRRVAPMREAEIIERGLSALGPGGGFVVVSTQATANIRWANSTLTTNGLTHAQQVSVVSFDHDGQSGAAGIATGALGATDPAADQVELAGLVQQAQSAARVADRAQDYSPPYAGQLGSGPDPGWEEPATGVEADELAAVTEFLGEVLSGSQPHRATGPEFFGYAEQSVSTMHLGTTTGIRARMSVPAARFELCGKSHNRTRSAWAGRAGTWMSDLDLGSSGPEVTRGLAHQANRVEVEPGHHTAVLSSSAAADMLVYLLWSASARDALDGRSALRGLPGGPPTAIGRSLCPLPLTVRSDPAAAGMPAPDRVVALGSGPLSSTFDTGMPVPGTQWISDGTLSALATTRESARRGGLADTPLADNLLVDVAGCTGSLDELAERVGDGLLVTCLWYIREVDAPTLLLTGLTRDGVYVVRSGEIVGACGNFRFNESPLGMLNRLTDAGTPVRCLPREWGDYFTMTAVAPLAISAFNFSTTSDAV